jgi:hypothetical protein
MPTYSASVALKVPYDHPDHPPIAKKELLKDFFTHVI